MVSAVERYVFHKRLTHTLGVAQVGRRLAEKLLKDHGEPLASALGGLDPDVVEAACLAHDLGHPPFGHVAEQELDSLACNPGSFSGLGMPEGFSYQPRLNLPYFVGMSSADCDSDGVAGFMAESATVGIIAGWL